MPCFYAPFYASFPFWKPILIYHLVTDVSGCVGLRLATPSRSRGQTSVPLRLTQPLSRNPPPTARPVARGCDRERDERGASDHHRADRRRQCGVKRSGRTWHVTLPARGAPQVT